MHEGMFFADLLWNEKIKSAHASNESNCLHTKLDYPSSKKVVKQWARQSRELQKPYLARKGMILCLREIIVTTLVI